jgi:HK97 family phage portal protein
MWPFSLLRRERRRERGVVTLPGNWITNTTGNPWGSLDPAWSSISPAGAEALAAVASCVSLISETIAALPAVVVSADDQRQVQVNHPLSRLVVEGPNPIESWSDLVASLVASTLLRGNGLAEIGTDQRGQLASLTTIPFEQTTAWLSATGALRFDYMPTQPPAAGMKCTLTREEVVLLKDRSDGGILGVPRLQRSANAVQHAIATQTNSFRWMANAARPSGTLNAAGKVSPQTMDRLSLDWDANHSPNSERFAKTAVLPEGLEFKPLGWLTADDAQIVERLSYSVRDVARVFGVPVFLLADETRTTFASASAALQYFAGNTLRPWVVRIERAFQQSVLDPRYRFHIDLTALIKADPDAFAAALLKMRQGGFLTANEARAMLDLPPHPEGDSITPPSVMSAKDQRDDGPPVDPPPPAKSKLNGRHAHH